MKTASNHLPRLGQFALVALALAAWGGLFAVGVNWLLPRKAPAIHASATHAAAETSAPSPDPIATGPVAELVPSSPLPEAKQPAPTPNPGLEERETALVEKAAASPSPGMKETATAMTATIPPNDVVSMTGSGDVEEILLASADWRRKNGDVTGALESCLSVIGKYPGAGATAARGRVEAVFAQLQRREITLHRDDQERFLSLAAQCGEQNVVAAMLFLGEHFCRENPKESYEWYAKAAGLGNAEALRMVGDYYFSGISGFLTSDTSKAADFYEKAVAQGDLRAKACLGELYLEGRAVPLDEAKGLSLIREATADKKDARAMNYLGDYLYRNARNHPADQRQKDYEEAFALFTACKEIHYLNGVANLGVMYMAGTAPGLTEPEPTKGASLFAEGAKKSDPLCMYYYARCLEGGLGVKKNRVEAEYWYNKAAAAGEPRSIEWLRSHKPSTLARSASSDLGGIARKDPGGGALLF